MTVVCAGCDGQLSGVAAAPAAAFAGGPNEQTVEVVPLRSIGLVPSTPISVEVQNGDISVVALDATQFFSGAIFIEDDIVFVKDITETLAVTSRAELVSAESEGGQGGPRAITHLRVPDNGVDLYLHSQKGAIFIGGKFGNITASADDGRIEVRGQTAGLTLTVNGKHAIVVDGESGQLNLSSIGGLIDVTTARATSHISITTVTGEIMFSGRPDGGDHYFSAGAASRVTLVLPRDLKFDIVAQTSGQPISIQYPTTPTPVTVCVTMDPGWPVDAHYDSTYGKPRAQVMVRPAGAQITTPVVISGTLGPGYLLFHTTMHTFSALLPDLSDLSIDQVDQAPSIPSVAAIPIVAAGPAVVQNPQDVTDPALLAQLESFKSAGGDVALATPLTAPLNVRPSGGAVPMRGHNCAVAPPAASPVRVFVAAKGGAIRILQMSPGN